MTKITGRLHAILLLATIMIAQLFVFGCDKKTTEPEEPEIRKPAESVEGYWNEFEWDDLNSAEQAAWRALGWDKKSWDSEDPSLWPDSEFKSWAELSDSERENATRLGYNQMNWDETLVRKPAGDVETFWNQFAWDDLYPAEQALWAVLGWSQSSWDSEDSNDWPASEEKDWIDLTNEEQEAATALGYDQEYWDSV